MDLNNLSSNILLIGLVLISLCCLYLLYSNFSKVREIEELKRRVEDLKKIFLNQQAHNEETFSNIKTIITALPNNNNTNTRNLESRNLESRNLDPRNHDFQNINNSIASEVITEIAETIKTVNLNNTDENTKMLEHKDITVNKEGYQSSDSHSDNSNIEIKNAEEKEINLDLEDLDNLNVYQPDDNISLNDLDDNCEEIDVDSITQHTNNVTDSKKVDSSILANTADIAELLDNGDIEITKDNLFIIEPVINSGNEVFDELEDDLSIATEPIGDSNDVINNTNNFNLDDIKDIDDIDNLDDIINNTKPEITEVKTIKLDNITSINDKPIEKTNEEIELDLDEILNGNNTVKLTDTNIDTNKDENIKKIEVTDSSKPTLHTMSIKQLKDLAKSHKLKTTGTKQELIAMLEKIIQ